MSVRASLSASFQYIGEWNSSGSSWRMVHGFPVDVIESEAGWCAEAIAQAQTNRDPEQNPVLPLPYLVRMKFEASRAEDIADITRILGQAEPDELAKVHRLFQTYLGEEMEDLESLILLGQLEFA